MSSTTRRKLMTDQSAATIAERAIKILVGKRCWHVVCGRNVGASFNLFLGKMVKKTTPPSHSKLIRKIEASKPKFLREYEAEFRLLVWTSWRLSRHGSVVLTSSDCEDDAYPVKEQLRRRLSFGRLLKGSTIKSAEIISPFYDVKLMFNNGYELEILCHRGKMKPTTDPRYTPVLSNWDIFVPGNFVVKV